MRIKWKHVAVTLIVLLIGITSFSVIFGFSLAYKGNIIATSLDNEGPHITYCGLDTIQIEYILQVNNKQFQVNRIKSSLNSLTEVSCYYPLDSTHFRVPLHKQIFEDSLAFKTKSEIIAISDIEGNFSTLRKLLKNNGVIDANLNWAFGTGHLVLLGDFVDRGSFVTQTLWFIYKLEHQAREKGGYVHYILGNHELKNLYGDYYAAPQKYIQTAGILGKQQYELYNNQSFIGRWLENKNVVLKINDNVFMHGGLHPDILKYNLSLDEINSIVKKTYRKFPYHNTEPDSVKLITDNQTGVCWYRGYFDAGFKEESINSLLNRFNVKHIIVGHTIQDEVKSLFNGKLFAIDVLHPQDQYSYFPERNSEGLLIKDENYYKLDKSGKRYLIYK